MTSKQGQGQRQLNRDWKTTEWTRPGPVASLENVQREFGLVWGHKHYTHTEAACEAVLCAIMCFHSSAIVLALHSTSPCETQH